MQGRKLFIGNLDYTVSRDDLAELFATYGEVREVSVIEGKGFGFMHKPFNLKKLVDAVAQRITSHRNEM